MRSRMEDTPKGEGQKPWGKGRRSKSSLRNARRNREYAQKVKNRAEALGDLRETGSRNRTSPGGDTEGKAKGEIPALENTPEMHVLFLKVQTDCGPLRVSAQSARRALMRLGCVLSLALVKRSNYRKGPGAYARSGRAYASHALAIKTLPTHWSWAPWPGAT